jgi:prevent-host-death family protein
MSKTFNIQEAKTNLSKLVHLAVDGGDEVIIASRGVPAVRLEPITKKTKRELGFVAGKLPDSFFEPLPEEELQAWAL